MVNGLWVLLLAVVVFICAIATGWRLLFHLTWLLLAVTAFGYLWTRLAFRGLLILRDSTQTRIEVGQTLRERLGMRNMSLIPKLWLEVRDAGNLPGRSTGNIVSLGATSEKRWRRRTVCTQRGSYRLGPLRISSADPFGLFRRSVQIGTSRDLLVFPQVLSLHDFVLPALELPGGNVSRRRTFDSTPTVTTVRDYVAGDSLSKVSWKATARQQKLMVKEFELDPVADVWMVLDLDRKLHVLAANADRRQPPDPQRMYLNSTLEYAVTAAASVASTLLEKGRSVGLITWSGGGQVLPPDRGSRQLWKLLEVLAVAQPTETPPLREVLLAHQSEYAGNIALVVVSPNLSGDWRASLEIRTGRTVPATAIYVDALSFDPRLPRLLPIPGQPGSRFYSYTLRNGDDIREKLSRGALHARSADTFRLEALR